VLLNSVHGTPTRFKQSGGMFNKRSYLNQQSVLLSSICTSVKHRYFPLAANASVQQTEANSMSDWGQNSTGSRLLTTVVTNENTCGMSTFDLTPYLQQFGQNETAADEKSSKNPRNNRAALKRCSRTRDWQQECTNCPGAMSVRLMAKRRPQVYLPSHDSC